MNGRKYPVTNVTVRLVGTDGNAFARLGKVRQALRRAGYDAGSHRNAAISFSVGVLIVQTSVGRPRHRIDSGTMSQTVDGFRPAAP